MGATSEHQVITALFEANKVLLAHHPKMPLAIANGLYATALWGHNRPDDQPRSIINLAEIIGLPYTSVSRHFRYLGQWERAGTPGLQLVETTVGEDDRSKCVRLTDKGHGVIREVCATVRRHSLL